MSVLKGSIDDWLTGKKKEEMQKENLVAKQKGKWYPRIYSLT